MWVSPIWLSSLQLSFSDTCAGVYRNGMFHYIDDNNVNTHLCIYIYIYIYVCVCVFVVRMNDFARKKR